MLTKLQFKPGVNREATTLSNEGGWYDCNNIRFRSGYPEKIGGWTTDTGTEPTTQAAVNPSNGANLATTNLPTVTPPTTAGYNMASFWGVCRSLWAWLNLAGYNLLGLGTNLKYYIQNGIGGAFYDITPIRTTTTGATFTLVAGSANITVTDNANGAQANDFVTFSGVTSTDTRITAAILNAEFQIVSVAGNTYTITASITANASGTQGGGSVSAAYQLTTGSSTYTDNLGWGAGGWGGYNSGAIATTVGSTLTANNTTITASASTSSFPTTGTLAIFPASSVTPAYNATNLTTAITNASTSIIGGNLTGFPTTGMGLLFNNTDYEYFTYTGITGNTFTGCTRGQNGTTAAAHSAGVTISVYVDAPEIVTYTGISGSTFTGCVRGANGTQASTHSTGALIYNSLTTGSSAYSGWGAAAPTAFGIGQQLRLWSNANYGQDLIICPGNAQMYYWAVYANPTIFNRAQNYTAGSTIYTASGSFTCDSSTPSLVSYVIVSDSSNFVICLGCNDPSGVVGPTYLDPMLVRWSDQQGAGTWLPTATNQAGSYRLSQGSQIAGVIPAQQGILVFTDTSVYIMQYVGPPYVWGFNVMASNTSIMGPNAVSNINNTIYWMGYNKFYFYNGTVQTLPCAVRQYVFDNINLQQSNQVYSGTNEAYNEVWWFYPSVTGRNSDGSLGTGTPSNPNVLTDSYVIYNYVDQTWYYGAMQRTAWLYSPLRLTPVATNYYGQLIYQESGVNDGTTFPQPSGINAFIQSSDFDIGDGNSFGFVWRVIPDINFTGSFNPNPSVNLTLLPRQNPGNNYGVANNPTVISQQNYTNEREYLIQTFTSQLYVRARGRQLALKIQSTGLGVQWQSGIHRIDIRPDGRR